jgi:hypothetical protein
MLQAAFTPWATTRFALLSAKNGLVAFRSLIVRMGQGRDSAISGSLWAGWWLLMIVILV